MKKVTFRLTDTNKLIDMSEHPDQYDKLSLEEKRALCIYDGEIEVDDAIIGVGIISEIDYFQSQHPELARFALTYYSEII